MATLNQSSQEALCAEILADARRQSDQIVQHAQQEADALLSKAASEAEKVKQQRLELARAEATRRKELILATVPVEAGRLRAARIEALLEAIYTEARRRLAGRSDFGNRETIIALAAEAISRMAGDAFLVELSSAAYGALGSELAQEIAVRVGRASLSITISGKTKLSEAGLIVRDVDRRQVWDNRLPARLERLWPELRRQLAVQSSLVADKISAGASRSAQKPPVAPASPVEVLREFRPQHGSEDDGRAHTNTSSANVTARPGGGAK